MDYEVSRDRKKIIMLDIEGMKLNFKVKTPKYGIKIVPIYGEIFREKRHAMAALRYIWKNAIQLITNEKMAFYAYYFDPKKGLIELKMSYEPIL